MREKNPVLIKVGGNLRRLRLAAGLSQEALAFECGLDRSYIGGVERGERNVSVINLCRIAAALGTTASECLSGVVCA